MRRGKAPAGRRTPFRDTARVLRMTRLRSAGRLTGIQIRSVRGRRFEYAQERLQFWQADRRSPLRRCRTSSPKMLANRATALAVPHGGASGPDADTLMVASSAIPSRGAGEGVLQRQQISARRPRVGARAVGRQRHRSIDYTGAARVSSPTTPRRSSPARRHVSDAGPDRRQSHHRAWRLRV